VKQFSGVPPWAAAARQLPLEPPAR
jgi:hypothetical protein